MKSPETTLERRNSSRNNSSYTSRTNSSNLGYNYHQNGGGSGGDYGNGTTSSWATSTTDHNTGATSPQTVNGSAGPFGSSLAGGYNRNASNPDRISSASTDLEKRIHETLARHGLADKDDKKRSRQVSLINNFQGKKLHVFSSGLSLRISNTTYCLYKA